MKMLQSDTRKVVKEDEIVYGEYLDTVDRGMNNVFNPYE